MGIFAAAPGPDSEKFRELLPSRRSSQIEAMGVEGTRLRGYYIRSRLGSLLSSGETIKLLIAICFTAFSTENSYKVASTIYLISGSAPISECIRSADLH